MSQVFEEEDDGSGGVDGEFSAEDLAAMHMCEDWGFEVRQRPARIFDGFIYKNEIDLLEVRSEEIGHLVTGMILVEAGRTFQGAAKDLVFPMQASRLPPGMQGKIKHVVEDFSALPANADAWAREYAQRDSIAKGLGDGSAPGDARPDDMVLISDVDEIPKHELFPPKYGAAVVLRRGVTPRRGQAASTAALRGLRNDAGGRMVLGSQVA